MSSEKSKRRRACEACHVLKARCEQTSEDNTEVCDRCLRLGRECVPAPRRLQKDRIAELEAQVEELTRALKSHGIVEPSPPASDGRKKRRLEREDDDVEDRLASDPSPGSSSSDGPDILAFVDSLVPLDLQERVIAAYNRSTLEVLPLVHGAPLDLDSLRSETPFLAFCIIAFPTSNFIEPTTQYELVDKAMELFLAKTSAGGERSLELLQALLVSCFWFRARPGFKHATVLQLVQLSMSIAADLGVNVRQPTHDSPPSIQRTLYPSPFEARRIWLACFVAMSGQTTVLRKLDVSSWTKYHDECLEHVRSSLSLPGDPLFVCIVKAEELCHRIVTQLELCDITRYSNITDDATKARMSQLRTSIDDWTAQIPFELRQPLLYFWRHVALIYLNESVLHTQLNKYSFSPPFVNEKIIPSDFANPVVTVDHVASLYALKDACQCALDWASELDPVALLNMASLFYIPRMLYSLFVLVKLFVAVTAPGNTFGAVLSKNELRLPHYFAKMKTLAIALQSLDSTEYPTFNTQMLLASVRLGVWFEDYSQIVENYEEDNKPKEEATLYQEPLEAWDEAAALTYNAELDKTLTDGDFLFGDGFVETFGM